LRSLAELWDRVRVGEILAELRPGGGHWAPEGSSKFMSGASAERIWDLDHPHPIPCTVKAG